MIGELKECKEELKERVRERGETDEQAKQHRSMICALEERLNVAVNKNKEHQAEIARLLETVSGNVMQQGQQCNFKSLLFIITLFVTIIIQWEIGGTEAFAAKTMLHLSTAVSSTFRWRASQVMSNRLHIFAHEWLSKEVNFNTKFYLFTQ